MFLGYNTNGMVQHKLLEAIDLLGEIGYRGVAITINHNAIAEHDPWHYQHLSRLRRLLKDLGMRSVIETGASFLLNARHKHEPTLLSTNRRRRIQFCKYAIDCAAELNSDCVSLWSGTLREPLSAAQAMDRLIEGLEEIVAYAAEQGVVIGFEPEPGMFIDSMASYEQLLRFVNGNNFQLTLDIGHLHCQGEIPIDVQIRRWASRLVNVHIEDMRQGIHKHLMFGDGEIDFLPICKALTEIGYRGGVYVELNRHSHTAPERARQAFNFLHPLITSS